MGEFQNYYAEGNKPGKMEYILYGSIYKILENANESVMTGQWLPADGEHWWGAEEKGLTGLRRSRVMAPFAPLII